MKPCPHCGKEIQDKAMKCRWCLKFIDTKVGQPISSKQNPLGIIKALRCRFKRLGLVIAIAIALLCSVTLYLVFVRSYDDSTNPLVLKVMAMLGNANAQYQLGNMYSTGDAGIIDRAKAVVLFQKAAEHGNADAQYILGDMYAKGEGVPEDSAKAVELFQKAAEQGNANAQYRLGGIYSSGDKGVPKDSTKAFKWYEKAAEQGNDDAKAALNVIKAFGDEIVCNVNTADYTGEGNLDPFRSGFPKYNQFIKNIHTFIKQDDGILSIFFDFDLRNHPYFELKLQFLVRMFDTNGRYIAHFITKEFKFSNSNRKINRLQNEGNVLQYPVNLRDATFISSIEFGIVHLIVTDKSGTTWTYWHNGEGLEMQSRF